MTRLLTPPKKRANHRNRANGYLEENLGIPVGAASRTNKVRWKKPSPVIKRTTKRK